MIDRHVSHTARRRGMATWMALLALLCILIPMTIEIPATAAAASAPTPAQQLWTAPAESITASAGWALHGIRLAGALRLAPSSMPLACAAWEIDGGRAAYDPAAGLCAGHDPYAPGGYDGRNYYNGGRFYYGTLLSPPRAVAPFDQAIVSWAADTPPGAWLQAHLRVRLPSGAWTHWYAMPVWAGAAGTVRRHSIDGQSGPATVDTDTLLLRHGAVAAAYQLSVTLFTAAPALATTSTAPSLATHSPALRRLTLALSRGTPADPPAVAPSAAWGRDLPVPARSQMLAAYRAAVYGPYGGGGENWCSPTSTSMVLAYWARVLGRPDLDESVPQAALSTYDWTYQGTGNWPFNVAHAASFTGMDGYVARFSSLAALEPWIAAGVPLVLGVAFGPGALPGAPIPSTNGHLLVLRGFDRAGDPIVNDPAAPDDATVRRVYPRAALQQAWLSGSHGTAYVIFPHGWHIPG